MDFVWSGMVFFLAVIGIRVLNHKLPHIPSFARNKVATILIVFIGTGLVYVVSVTEVRMIDIGNWGRSHLLQIFLFWGMLAGVIALSGVANAKALQWIMAGIVTILIVVIPFGVWVTSPSAPRQQVQQQGAQQNNLVARQAWTKLIIPARGRSENITKPFNTHIVTDGHDHLIHDVYRDGHECLPEKEKCTDGDIPSAYITNELDRENVIYYMHVPKR